MRKAQKRNTKQIKHHWADYFTPTVKTSITVAALIGAIATGVWSLDGRFAKAEDVKEQLQGVRRDLNRVFMRIEQQAIEDRRRALESEKRQLTREQFDLVAIQQKRRLTEIELARLRVVTEEIGQLSGEIKVLTEKERDLEKK